MLEDRDFSGKGFAAVSAEKPDCLVFATNPDARVSYTSTATVVVNIPIYASLDTETAIQRFNTMLCKEFQSALFVVPPGIVTSSRRSGTNTDATSEPGAGQDHRTTIIDGFGVLALENVSQDRGAVDAIDRCHGPLFAALMGTFHGLELPDNAGLILGDRNVSNFDRHTAEFFNGSVYGHFYQFQSVYSAIGELAVSGTDWTQVTDVTSAHINRSGAGYIGGSTSFNTTTDRGEQPLTT